MTGVQADKEPALLPSFVKIRKEMFSKGFLLAEELLANDSLAEDLLTTDSLLVIYV